MSSHFMQMNEFLMIMKEINFAESQGSRGTALRLMNGIAPHVPYSKIFAIEQVRMVFHSLGTISASLNANY